VRHQCAQGHFYFLNRLLSSFCSVLTRAHGFSCIIPIEARPLPIVDVMQAPISSWTVSSLLKTCFSARSPSFRRVETVEKMLIDRTRHYSHPAMTKTSEISNQRSKRVLSPILKSLLWLARTGLERQILYLCLLARSRTNHQAGKVWPCRSSHRLGQSRPSSHSTVCMLLSMQIKAAFMHPQFQSDRDVVSRRTSRTPPIRKSGRQMVGFSAWT